MTGFEPASSGIVNDHVVNCATTTAQIILCILPVCPNDQYSLYLQQINVKNIHVV